MWSEAPEIKYQETHGVTHESTQWRRNHTGATRHRLGNMAWQQGGYRRRRRCYTIVRNETVIFFCLKLIVVLVVWYRLKLIDG